MLNNKLIIDKLYYSPIKSLSFYQTKKLKIKKKVGILNDRIYAFTKGISKNLSIKYENNPKSRNLNNFLTLRNSPKINNYKFVIKGETLFFYFKSKLVNKVLIKNRNKIADVLKNKLPEIEDIFFISNIKYPFFDTMPNNSISLINMSSIKDFEKRINRKIEHERFRGNIYIKNLDPWHEFKLLNKTISINKCLFLVLSKIPRCSATNLKINTDKSDINLPLKLINVYGHRNLGVYLKPLNNGFIQVGDKIVF